MNTACIPWHGALDRKGYGRRTYQGVTRLAHRVAYINARGPIPSGMTVDHLCFNRACVNPDHLRLLSHRDNCANQRSALATHCQRGHEFTPENTLRRVTSDGRRTCRECKRASNREHARRKRVALRSRAA